MTPIDEAADSDQELAAASSSSSLKADDLEIDSSLGEKLTNKDEIFEVETVKPKIILFDDCAPTKGYCRLFWSIFIFKL